MSPTNLPLWARGASSPTSTFTSWNKCMATSYCKWPVIAGIIIGSVIVIAVLGCIINCLCCGYACCAACCGCCSCCCPSGRRRNKQPKYYDEAPLHPAQHSSTNPYQSPQAPPAYRGAVQTATFENSKGAASKVDEDSLPAMPTWAGGRDKHIEDDTHRSEDMEMEPLNPHGQTPDRAQGANTPSNSGAAHAEFPPPMGTPTAGYRGFNPTDPYARRSPGPAGALAAAQDPYGRRSPGLSSPVDPYGRRSPGPGSYAGAQDPYGQRSPVPQDHQPYHQPYGNYNNNNNNNNNFRGLTSPSPVAAYKPPTTYSPVPMPFTPSTDANSQGPGFTRQNSLSSSQYPPPSYATSPPYRGVSPALPTSPPPPFQAPSPQGYVPYGANEYGHNGGGIGTAIGEPGRNRPPTLLQSGRQPAPNSFRDV